jgi:predicted phage terminase large subunit-like protein
LVEHLEKVERGDIDRLLISMPPRHGKTLAVSQLFPSWYLGKHPDRSIIATSYSAEFAVGYGRQVKRFVTSAAHRTVFPASALLDNNVASHRLGFHLGGHYYATGAMGPIVGRGAHVFLIDDPVKSRAEVQSVTQRNSLREWYQSVVYTRLEPDAAIILIMTRWSQDDLVGWLLAEHGDEHWTVLSLPAIAEPGDQLGRAEGAPLWPKRFGLRELERRRLAVGSFEWAAQYQGRPVAPGGNIFQADWFRRFDDRERPELLQTVISLDTAYKTGQTNDYSVIMVIGEGRTGYYVLHVTRERLEFPALKRRATALAEIWSPNYLLVEDSASGQSLIQSLRSETSLPVLPYRVSADKLSRAHAVSPLIESGRVSLPLAAHWLPDFLAEIIAFPAAPHDDQVDALTMALNYLRENRWSQPLMMVAPSTSWLQQRDPVAYRDGCAEADAIEDGEFGPIGIAFVRRTKSKWDAM